MDFQTLIKDIDNIKIVAEAFLAVSAGLIIIWKSHQVFSKIKDKFIEWDLWKTKTTETLNKAVSDIAHIKSEFHTNGGSTVKDSLNRIELRQILADQKLWALHMDSGLGIFETDETGDCIKVNRTYLKMTGRLEHEVLGKGWVLCIAEYDRERVFEEWNNAVTQQREFFLEYDFVTSEGKTFPVLGIAHALRDGKGKIKGWIGLIRQDNILEELTNHDENEH